MIIFITENEVNVTWVYERGIASVLFNIGSCSGGQGECDIPALEEAVVWTTACFFTCSTLTGYKVVCTSRSSVLNTHWLEAKCPLFNYSLFEVAALLKASIPYWLLFFFIISKHLFYPQIFWFTFFHCLGLCPLVPVLQIFFYLYHMTLLPSSRQSEAQYWTLSPMQHSVLKFAQPAHIWLQHGVASEPILTSL